MISGWAVDPGAIYRYQVDAAFPLSDHADYTDLIRYVELVEPTRVLTLHGFAAEFARDLRERGIEAWALTEENQMELGFALGSAANASPARTSPAPIGDSRVERLSGDSNTPASREPGGEVASISRSEFLEFAEVGEKIAATP